MSHLNATFKRASVEAAIEFGSLEELAGFIGEKNVLLTKLFGEDMEIVVKGLADVTSIATGTVENAETEQGTETTTRRGRKPKDKNQPDPAAAAAPPPAPIPGAAPDTTPGANGIPAFLDRTNPPAPAAPPAPPPPPPAAPVAPPSGILAGKVIAALDARAANDDLKAQLVAWLAGPTLALVQPGSSYVEAVDAIRLMSDDKLAAAATGLQIA